MSVEMGKRDDDEEMAPLAAADPAEPSSPVANPQPKAPPLGGQVKLPHLGVAAVVLVGILSFPGELELEGVAVPAAKKCLAILICVSVLWATEAIPLYSTSLLVPLLTVGTGALLPEASKECLPGDLKCRQSLYIPYPPAAAAKEICSQFFDPTVLLFMAGFSIGAVLEKQRLSNMIASVLLRPFGNKPQNLLLGIMLLGAFLSMWISNVPASVLCVSLAQPIVHGLPQRDPFSKALLIGIAISNNIGGMTTPIASPQNVIAFNWCGQVGASMTFLTWLVFSVPFCGLLLFAAWGIILYRYPPMLKTLQIGDLTRDTPRMNPSQMVALGITTATVLAWAFWKPLDLEPIFGSMGLVGLVPIILFFSIGLLDRNDFHNALNWSVLVLIGGGLALGHVMQRSYLLQIMSLAIQSSLSGAGLWTYMTAFSLFMALVANFISSTVAAIIILPVVANVGKSVGHAASMIVSSVLMDSAAMALPVSSFPNANSFAVVRRNHVETTIEEGQKDPAGSKAGAKSGSFLEVQDYIITGGMVTIVAQLEVCTLGYLGFGALFG